MTEESIPDNGERLEMPELSVAGFAEAIDRLAILSEAGREYKYHADTAPHSYAKKAGENWISTTQAVELGIQILDLIAQKPAGSWAEEVEKRRVEMFEQSQLSQDTEKTQPEELYPPEYMD